MTVGVGSSIAPNMEGTTKTTGEVSKKVISNGHSFTSHPLEDKSAPSGVKSRLFLALTKVSKESKQIIDQPATPRVQTSPVATHAVDLTNIKEHESINAKIIKLEKAVLATEVASKKTAEILLEGLDKVKEMHSKHLSTTFKQQQEEILSRHRSELMKTENGIELQLLRAASQGEGYVPLREKFGENALLRVLTPFAKAEKSLENIEAIESAIKIQEFTLVNKEGIKKAAEGLLERIGDYNLNAKELETVKNGLSLTQDPDFSPTDPNFTKAITTLKSAAQQNVMDTFTRFKKAGEFLNGKVGDFIKKNPTVNYGMVVEQFGEKAVLDAMRSFAKKELSEENITTIEHPIEIEQLLNAKVGQVKEIVSSLLRELDDLNITENEKKEIRKGFEMASKPDFSLSNPDFLKSIDVLKKTVSFNLVDLFERTKLNKGFSEPMKNLETVIEKQVKLDSVNELKKLNEAFVSDQQKATRAIAEKRAEYKKA